VCGFVLIGFWICIVLSETKAFQSGFDVLFRFGSWGLKEGLYGQNKYLRLKTWTGMMVQKQLHYYHSLSEVECPDDKHCYGYYTCGLAVNI